MMLHQGMRSGTYHILSSSRIPFTLWLKSFLTNCYFREFPPLHDLVNGFGSVKWCEMISGNRSIGSALHMHVPPCDWPNWIYFCIICCKLHIWMIWCWNGLVRDEWTWMPNEMIFHIVYMETSFLCRGRLPCVLVELFLVLNNLRDTSHLNDLGFEWTDTRLRTPRCEFQPCLIFKEHKTFIPVKRACSHRADWRYF